MINILLNIALLSVLVFIWVKQRSINFNVRDLEERNGYLHRLIKGLRADNARLTRRTYGDGTYTYEDSCGNKYDDALEVTYNDIFLIIKRRSGSVAIPRDNNKGYTMTKNIIKEEPESAKDS